MTTYIPSLTLPTALFANGPASVLLPIISGTAVGYATRPRETQKTYLALKQPPLRPPPQVFGPVWTLLYGLMGYAAHRAWTSGSLSLNPVTRDIARHGATLYSIQLGLNLIWMPLFFELKQPIAAAADIVALTGTTAYLAYQWSQVDEVAAWCLAPYLGWLGFATYLTFGCGYLNNWDFSNKEAPKTSSSSGTFVNERKDL